MDDFNLVRQNKICPLCGNHKAVGMLTCEVCYKAHNLENNVGAYFIKIMQNMEEDLRVEIGL